MTSDRQKPPGRWKRGESGNPAGRPRGSGSVAQLRASISAHLPAIIARLVESAKAGDVSASRLLLERVCAPLKASEDVATVALDGASLSDQGRRVLAAVGAGTLAPGQGAALLAALGALAGLIESDELARRVEHIESKLAHTEAPQ